VRGDVTNAADLERLVERTLQAFGELDILVWNSGGPPPGRASEIDDNALESAFELLLQPLVRLVRLCLPHLQKSEGGRIICLTSAAVKEPTDHLALSTRSAGRHRLREDALTRARPRRHHRQLRRAGRVQTPRMTELYGKDGPGPEQLAQIPIGRLGKPREFGDVVCFLASERASYVTGVTLLVDGGLSRGLL
jgi:Dehydrogenases with different specificities (related to short-chain alcohol dehydrogenases)